ncbi:MAG: NAD-dependent epimerase [Hyphomicrobiaceae bacterium]
MRILVTGAAGFIGFHTAQALLKRGDEVVGIDNLNPYYDVSLKEARLALLEGSSAFRMIRGDLADRAVMDALFSSSETRPDRVVHLAAQAGVRHAEKDPYSYGNSNLVGFLNLLEACRHAKVEHLVFASSSSVYGANTNVPFSVTQNVDHPISLYAATKKANELMAHSYAHLYRLPVTGLRFFTVYGPWGRPDMAMFKFAKAILAGQPIELYNHGNHSRDFTYVDDVVEGVCRTLDAVAAPDPDWSGATPSSATSSAPYRLYNIGNNQPVHLLDLLGLIETELGRKAERTLLPLQPGDVVETYADVDRLVRDVGFRPSTPIAEGVRRFIAWYRSYYQC